LRRERLGPHFFELISNFSPMVLELISDGGMTFGDLSNITSKWFGDNPKVTFDLFHLLGSHGPSV